MPPFPAPERRFIPVFFAWPFPLWLCPLLLLTSPTHIPVRRVRKGHGKGANAPGAGILFRRADDHAEHPRCRWRSGVRAEQDAGDLLKLLVSVSLVAAHQPREVR